MKKLTAIIKYLFFPFLFAQSTEAVNWSSFIGNQTVTASVATENNVWVGTHNGLYVINAKTQKVTHMSAENSVLPSNEITGLVMASNGTVFAATSKGILRYDGYTNLVINSENSDLPENGISSMVIDNDDNLWIGTEGNGLILMNNYKCRFFNTKNSPLTCNNVSNVKNDNNGNIYVQLSNNDVVKVTDQGMKVITAPKTTDTKAIASRN